MPINKQGVKLIGATLSLAIAGTLAMGGVAQSTANTIEGPEVTVYIPDSNVTREASWNDGWKFSETSADCSAAGYNDSSWNTVTLPHDYSITKDFTTAGEAESGFILGGTGWYRKSFVIPASHQGYRKIVHFDGVYKDATVYVNGQKLGEHHYGYSAFSFDITDYLTFDGSTQNVVAVKVEHAVPSSRWYSGSGIYRDVKMYTVSPAHVSPYGVQVTTPDVSNGNGTAHIASEIANDGAQQLTLTVKNTVYSKATNAPVSSPVTGSITVPASSKATSTMDVPVNSYALWSPDSPNLFYVKTEVLDGSDVLDTYNTTFGYKWTEWTSTGFKLNGNNVKLNGVCLHHDQGALGSAGNEVSFRRQIQLLKDMGCNAIRTSHNPQDEDFVRLCSEMGVMVLEDNFDGWDAAKNGNSNDFAKYCMTELGTDNHLLDSASTMKWYEFAMTQQIKRDRNQASLIGWCIGNEIQEGAYASANFPTISQRINELVTEHDGNGAGGHTHATMIGNNGSTNANVVGAATACDVIGLNYNVGQISNLIGTYGKILRTETASHVNSRGTYQGTASRAAVDGAYHLTSYDTSTVGWGQTAHDTIYTTYTNDAIMGEFVWTGFDYIGEPTPWNGTGSGSVSGAGAYPNSSYFGIIDTSGFPKDNYYYYQSQWRKDGSTTLHIVNSWDSANMIGESSNRVDIYSNAPYVELLIGDEVIGKAIRQVNTSASGNTYYTYTSTAVNSDKCEAISRSGSSATQIGFTVKAYDSARPLVAKAYTSEAKATEITDTLGTSSLTKATNPSVKVKSSTQSINAGEMTYIEIDMEDANGNLSTTSDALVTVSLSGSGARLKGLDNGDQATLQKYQNSQTVTSSTSGQINTFRGKALAIVEGTSGGSFTLTASASGQSATTPSITVVDHGGGEEPSENRLESYKYVQDYTVLEGEQPVFNTRATGTYTDGTTTQGTIAWSAIGGIYMTKGDYTISGILTFPDDTSIEAITVTGRLHVVPDCTKMRNAATACAVGTLPTLPSTVKGLASDATEVWDYPVVWEDVDVSDFSTVGTKVVNGTVTIPTKDPMSVTCSVSVEQAEIIEGTNIGTTAHIADDVDGGSDNKNALNDGIIPNNDSSGSGGTRWSNWNKHATQTTVTLTFSWDTVHIFTKSRMHYYQDSGVPSQIEFYYDGGDGVWHPITIADGSGAQYESSGYRRSYEYIFDEAFTAEKIKVVYTEKNTSSCIALYETEFFEGSYGDIELDTTDTLSDIKADGTSIPDFDPETLSYEAKGTATVTATSDANMGITVMPSDNGIVRIVTLAEDGTSTKTYSVKIADPCAHDGATHIENAVDATCTMDGYSGDTICDKCGMKIADGTAIPALQHDFSVLITPEQSPDCINDGREAVYQCSRCAERDGGHLIPALDHEWDNGSIIKPATETESGTLRYTCQRCLTTFDVVVPPPGDDIVLSTMQYDEGGAHVMTGMIFGDASPYNIVEYGILYYRNLGETKLDKEALDHRTPGRFNEVFTSTDRHGMWSLRIRNVPDGANYTTRSYVKTKNADETYTYVYEGGATSFSMR